MLQKITRSNSDPCPSTTKDTSSISPLDPWKTNGLVRTPSLPLSLGKEDDEDEDEDEDEEPRMGDLIIQAMPMPKPTTRLDRTPSLPPYCRGKQAPNNNNNNNNNVGSKVENEVNVGSRLLEKGPLGMIKLTRRASIDSSMLPPKFTTSKLKANVATITKHSGAKQSVSNSKNRQHQGMEPPNNNNATKTETKPAKLDKGKSISDQELDESQGCKDLGFSFDKKDLSTSVTKLLPALQRTVSLESGKLTRPFLSQSWQKPSSPLSAPPSSKRGDQEQDGSTSADVKAQIKFWARAVASNVKV